MKKVLMLVFSILTVAALLCSCSKAAENTVSEPSRATETVESTEAGVQENTNGDSQNPIMNFIGDYSNGRAIMNILPDGKDGAKITVTWASSVSVNSTWVMSGKCVVDENTLTIAYNDCVKTTRVYQDDGSVESETVEYENGSGKITINLENYNITWTDDQENVAKDNIFTWNR